MYIFQFCIFTWWKLAELFRSSFMLSEVSVLLKFLVFLFSVLFSLMVWESKKATQGMLELVQGFIICSSSSSLILRTIVRSRYLLLHCFARCPSSVLILNVTERGGDIMLICNGFQCYIAPFLWPQQRALAEKNRGWLPPLWAWASCYGYMTLDLKNKL